MVSSLGDLDAWRFVARDEAESLIAAAVESIELPPAQQAAGVSALRREWSRERVHAAMQLAIARRKASDRLTIPDLIADPEGVEMATPADVARHKADRLVATADGAPVLDLCTGIGGDAAMLPSAELVELDPIRAWMAEHNTGHRPGVCDAERADVGGRVVHLDPARRAGGRRIPRYADLLPGPAIIERVARDSRAACIKLNPGIDGDMLPAGELEIISRRGTLNQAVLWTGACAQHARSATLIDATGTAHTLAGEVSDAPHAPLGPFIATVDPAAERAGLLGVLGDALGVGMPHARLGLFSADAVRTSPWLAWFEVLDVLEWRRDRVKRALAAYDAGVVEVKTRAQVVDPDIEQKALRGSGGSLLTVFVYRFDDGKQRSIKAIITRRCSLPSPTSR